MEKDVVFFLGALSQLLGHGGVTSLSELTGISRVTITNAKHEIKVLQNDPNTRPVAETTALVRSAGAGQTYKIKILVDF